MKLSKLMGLATALFVFGCGQANALTIDFSAFANGALPGNSLVTPNATVTSSSGLFNLSNFFGAGQGGSICPFISASFNCQADLAFSFTNPIKNLTFNSYGYDGGDKALISLFNGSTLLTTLSDYKDALLNFTAAGTVTKITIKNLGNGAGYAYGSFKFDAVSTVPVPAALPLFATAIAAVGLVSRRRKAKR